MDSGLLFDACSSYYGVLRSADNHTCISDNSYNSGNSGNFTNHANSATHADTDTGCLG